MSRMKSSGMAYLCWFFIGCHYAYLGRWGTQFLFWITAGGLGIWAFFDFFLIPSKVRRYNLKISKQIEELELQEKNQLLDTLMDIPKQNKPYS